MALYLPLLTALLAGVGLLGGGDRAGRSRWSRSPWCCSSRCASAAIVEAFVVGPTTGGAAARGPRADPAGRRASPQQLQVSAAVGAFLVGIALSGPLADTRTGCSPRCATCSPRCSSSSSACTPTRPSIPPVLLPALALAVVTWRPSCSPASWPPAGPASRSPAAGGPALRSSPRRVLHRHRRPGGGRRERRSAAGRAGRRVRADHRGDRADPWPGCRTSRWFKRWLRDRAVGPAGGPPVTETVPRGAWSGATPGGPAHANGCGIAPHGSTDSTRRAGYRFAPAARVPQADVAKQRARAEGWPVSVQESDVPRLRQPRRSDLRRSCRLGRTSPDSVPLASMPPDWDLLVSGDRLVSTLFELAMDPSSRPGVSRCTASTSTRPTASGRTSAPTPSADSASSSNRPSGTATN